MYHRYPGMCPLTPLLEIYGPRRQPTQLTSINHKLPDSVFLLGQTPWFKEKKTVSRTPILNTETTRVSSVNSGLLFVSGLRIYFPLETDPWTLV